MTQTVLALQNVTKVFPGVVALDGVYLTLQKGEIQGLVGENGAGKSTLVKIISGALRPDGGTITIEGRSFSALTPYQARRLGIATVYQDQQLVPTLSVAENIFLGREYCTPFGRVDFRKIVTETERMFRQFGVTIDPKARVEDLPVAKRQEVAIFKALGENAKVLLLDEPTAALSGEQVQLLFFFIARLIEHGMTILYISHHLDEVLTIARRITVLRNGKCVGTFDRESLNKETLVEKMAGHALHGETKHVQRLSGAVILEGKELSDGVSFSRVTISVREGEIVGLLGVTGSGAQEVLRTFFGLRPLRQGTIFVRGMPCRYPSPSGMVAQGVFFMPEEMRREGLVLPLSYPKNVTLVRLRKVTRYGTIHLKKEESATEPYVQTLNIRLPRLHAEVGTLSGGNQRKVLLARALFSDANIWLLENPTQGIDVEARQEVQRLLLEARAMQKAILLFSSDLDELAKLADRILVFRNGRVSTEIHEPWQVTPKYLLSLMLGGE
ncbi:MAG: sugar ABC transporter ATP-binding protein [Atribacterota bacterium]